MDPKILQNFGEKKPGVNILLHDLQKLFSRSKIRKPGLADTVAWTPSKLTQSSKKDKKVTSNHYVLVRNRTQTQMQPPHVGEGAY